MKNNGYNEKTVLPTKKQHKKNKNAVDDCVFRWFVIVVCKIFCVFSTPIGCCPSKKDKIKAETRSAIRVFVSSCDDL